MVIVFVEEEREREDKTILYVWLDEHICISMYVYR